MDDNAFDTEYVTTDNTRDDITAERRITEYAIRGDMLAGYRDGTTDVADTRSVPRYAAIPFDTRPVTRNDDTERRRMEAAAVFLSDFGPDEASLTFRTRGGELRFRKEFDGSISCTFEGEVSVPLATSLNRPRAHVDFERIEVPPRARTWADYTHIEAPPPDPHIAQATNDYSRVVRGNRAWIGTNPWRIPDSNRTDDQVAADFDAVFSEKDGTND